MGVRKSLEEETEKAENVRRTHIQKKTPGQEDSTEDFRRRGSSEPQIPQENSCSSSSGREATRRTWSREDRPMSSARRSSSSFTRRGCPGTLRPRMRMMPCNSKFGFAHFLFFI